METFEFLGFAVSTRKARTGAKYHHMEPSVKSRKRLMEKVRGKLNIQTHWRDTAVVVGEVNRITRGWSEYFRFGRYRPVFHQMDDLIAGRLRIWLWKKHGKSHAAYRHYTKLRMREEFGLYRMASV